MLSSEVSCSDCKLEFIQKKWTKLLIKWVYKCLAKKKKMPSGQERVLSAKVLSDVMNLYKRDVCEDEIDKALLCNDEIEPFIKYKYPILRLKYLYEEQDAPKRLYIMASIVLYHCCINSREGVVHDDIYSSLTKYEQELVLKFCERLNDMETTLNNVDFAIKEAFTSVDRNKDSVSSTDTSFDFFKGRLSSDTVAQMSSVSTLKSSFNTLQSDVTLIGEKPTVISPTKLPPMKFTSLVTVMPSFVTDPSSYNPTESVDGVADQCMYVDSGQIDTFVVKTAQFDAKDNNYKKAEIDVARLGQNCNACEKKNDTVPQKNVKQGNNTERSKTKYDDIQCDDPKKIQCLADCSCTKRNSSEPCRGDSGSNMDMKACACDTDKTLSKEPSKLVRLRINRKITSLIIAILLLIIVITVLTSIVFLIKKNKKSPPKVFLNVESLTDTRTIRLQDGWKCTKNLCQKVHNPANEKIFPSYSRCTLQCSGPHLWPHPIGNTEFGSKVIALETNKLEYKLNTVSSELVQRHLAEALKLFIGDLAKLENTGKRFKTRKLDLDVKRMYIQLHVESDADPRLRLNTEEAYRLVIETILNQVIIKISSSSFCGVRHGLETLTQMILLDESSGYLITVSNADVRDAPSYKYRGLMIDTGRNYIPVGDIMRTVDGMATLKLNTFHWRISDVTSFPLFLSKVPQLFENGAYDRSMIYTKDDVEAIVKRAGVRGIRVLIEVASPGPVGRPWSWNAGANCPSNNNDSCDNVLCTILDSSDSAMNVLQDLYEEILEMTHVDDIFHMSNGIFSLSNCFNLMNNRDGFLDKALDRLKRANKGFLPKLPIVWYTQHLNKDYETKTWERFGVQLSEWKSGPSEKFLAKFKVIHSSKWDLACEIKKQRCRKYRSWQEMYSWKSWRQLQAFTVEGGEATLWTDLVNSVNLDYHLWPRAAAVAERLWSDIIVNNTADASVYVRLNSHRSRMLHAGVKVQPIWPAWCTYNPGPCLEKVQV